MSPRERAAIVQHVISGALSVREVCERHELSTQCVVDWVAEFRRASLDAFDAQLRVTLESQGIAAPLDVAASHFVVARGELALPDLLQLMALGRRSGVISVAHDGMESRLWCADGEVVDAESGKLQGLAAVYRVLAAPHGRISTSFSPDVDRPIRVRHATMELLMEGARRADECNVLRRALGIGCYRLAPTQPAHDGLSPAERATLSVFARPATIAEALAESVLGDLETLGLIRACLARGYLLPDSGSDRSPTLRPGASTSQGPQLLSLVSGAPSVRSTERSALVRTLLIGTAAGLAFGIAVWAALSAGDRGPTRLERPRASAVLPATAAPIAALPPAVRAASAAGASDAIAPTAASPVVATDVAALSVARPREPSPPSFGGDGEGVERAAIAAPATTAPPARPLRPAARPSHPAEAARGTSTSTAPSAMSAGTAGLGAPLGTPEAEEATREVPRMRIIEERVPKMRVVE